MCESKQLLLRFNIATSKKKKMKRQQTTAEIANLSFARNFSFIKIVEKLVW